MYRRITLFRKVFGAHPDEYRFRGITPDVETFVKEAAGEQHND